MAYSNTGPALLAAVIEKVTGQRFENYVRDNIFLPLGMDTASYLLTPPVEKNLTKMYENDGRTALPYWHILYRPAGSVNASTEDMANVLRFYHQRGSLDGRRLLYPASIDRMETPQTLPVFALSLLIPVGALLSMVAVWRHRTATMNRVAYWHSVSVTASLIFITGLGLYIGMIGWRLWT